MGGAGSSVVDEVFSRRVEEAAPWSFLALEFFRVVAYFFESMVA